MSIYAVVDGTGTIVNTVLWDGVSEWEGPKGMELVYCDSSSDCVIGGMYQNGVFLPPDTQEQTREDSIAEADQMKKSLLAEATLAIDPLQDAVDMGIATDDEQKQLPVWKKYRVLLNRVDVSQAPGIAWPERPQA
ncbi:TPA: tail fiber assembly protein [Escherichia coli]